jgi:hypothetical protein
LPEDTTGAAPAVAVAAPAIAPAVAAAEPVASAVAPAAVASPQPVSDGAPITEVPAVVAPEPPASPLAEPPKEPVAAEAPPAEPPAPEPIVYDLKFGDGIVVAPDDPLLSEFTTFAQERRLAPEDAQSLVDLYSKSAKNFSEALQKQVTQNQYDVFANTVKGWETQFRSDPEFKNRVDSTLEDGKWLIASYGGTAAHQQELRDILKSSGTGSHRAVIRLLANAGRALREARPIEQRLPQSTRAGSPADRRYGNMGAN